MRLWIQTEGTKRHTKKLSLLQRKTLQDHISNNLQTLSQADRSSTHPELNERLRALPAGSPGSGHQELHAEQPLIVDPHRRLERTLQRAHRPCDIRVCVPDLPKHVHLPAPPTQRNRCKREGTHVKETGAAHSHVSSTSRSFG